MATGVKFNASGQIFGIVRISTVSDGSDTFRYNYLTNSNLLASRVSPVHATSYSYESNRDLITVIDNLNTSGSISRDFHSEKVAFNLLMAESDWEYSWDADEARQCEDGACEASVRRIENWGPCGKDFQQNRLVGVYDGMTFPDQRISFSYDYMGRRVSKKVYKPDSDLETAYTFIYDGWNLIAEEVESYLQVFSPETGEPVPGPFTSRLSYLWGLDLSGAMQGAGGVGGLLKSGSSYYTYDANGNVSEVLNGSGSVSAHYEYDAFGRKVLTSGSGGSSFQFSTKYYDEELGLCYYGYRYYDAGVGRWLNRDPIEEEGGLNVYAFVGNNLLHSYDYLGQDVRYGPYGGSKDMQENIDNAKDAGLIPPGEMDNTDPGSGDDLNPNHPNNECCGGKTISSSSQCCVNDEPMDLIPLYKKQNQSLKECMYDYMNEGTSGKISSGIVNAGRIGGAILGSKGGPAGTLGGGAAGGALGKKAAQSVARQNCLNKVCPE